MRTLFNKPIRETITDFMYPDKMSIEEFKEIIVEHFQPYQDNMKGLNADDHKYIEQWIEQYLTWLDIEQN